MRESDPYSEPRPRLFGWPAGARPLPGHVPDDAARTALSGADDGAGGMKVLTQAGEQMTQRPEGLVGMRDELAGIAGAVLDAGVDLYLDASMLARLDCLKAGPNTALLLPNIDGPSLPLRINSAVLTEGALARSAGCLGWQWFRLGSKSVQAAIRTGSRELDQEATSVWIHDGDCVGAPEEPTCLRAVLETEAEPLMRDPLEESGGWLRGTANGLAAWHRLSPEPQPGVDLAMTKRAAASDADGQAPLWFMILGAAVLLGMPIYKFTRPAK